MLADALKAQYHRTSFPEFLQHAKVHYVVAGQHDQALETEHEYSRRIGWLSDVQATGGSELEAELDIHRRASYEFIHMHLPEWVGVPLFSYRRKAFSLREILTRLKQNKPLQVPDGLQARRVVKRVKDALRDAHRKVEFATIRQVLDDMENPPVTHFALTHQEDLQRCAIDFFKGKTKGRKKSFQRQVEREVKEWTSPQLVSTFLHALLEHVVNPTS